MKTDFRMREVAFSDLDYPEIRVVRMRTSEGHASITVTIEKQKFVFSSEKADDYEAKAHILAELLEEATNEPCLIDAKLPEHPQR